MIAPHDISVVLQGPLPVEPGGLQALERRIALLRQLLPGATIIVSTWRTAEVHPQTGADSTVYSTDPGALPAYKLGRCKSNNVNRQIISSAAGLAQVRTPFALKLRIDAGLAHAGALQALARLDPSARRIVTLGHFSLNPRLFERLPFHFSDWFQLGPTDSLRALWSCPLMTLEQATHYTRQEHAPWSNAFERRFLARWPAEQHVWRHHAAQRGYRVPGFHNDATPAVLAAHDRFLAQELLLLDAPQAGLRLPAMDWVARSGLQRFNCLNHSDWLAAAAQQGLAEPGAMARRHIRRRQRAQHWVGAGFAAAAPLLPLLMRPPLKRAASLLLKAADAWSRPGVTAAAEPTETPLPLPPLPPLPSIPTKPQTPC